MCAYVLTENLRTDHVKLESPWYSEWALYATTFPTLLPVYKCFFYIFSKRFLTTMVTVCSSSTKFGRQTQTSVPAMSEVLPAGRIDCLDSVGRAASSDEDVNDALVGVIISLSLWLSDVRLLVLRLTGRRRITAGRSRGGSINDEVTERVVVIRDCRAATWAGRSDDESLSSCGEADCRCCWRDNRRFTAASGRRRGVAVAAPRRGVSSISLHSTRYRLCRLGQKMAQFFIRQ